MKFGVCKNGDNQLRDLFAQELTISCLAHGHALDDPQNGISFVLNLTDHRAPRAFRRKSQSVFVFSIIALDQLTDDMKAICYTTLIKSLSNMLLCVVPSAHGERIPQVYFTTPEAGFYHIPLDAEEVYHRLLPIATAHFATENRCSTDLPARYAEGSSVVDSIKHYGKVMDALGVLPTPFPLRQVLSEDALRHLYKIYGITGASYGNLSARESIPELGATTFWMTGRGVNKANLEIIGKDILLVKGFDIEAGAALVSMPPQFDPRARVSVDAVEHELIYRSFPQVGAIVHVHAWIDGVLCTRQNYPCGTRELAEEVVALLRQSDTPGQTAIGLKNHGLTITGPTLDEIFARVAGRLKTQVAMFA